MAHMIYFPLVWLVEGDIFLRRQEPTFGQGIIGMIRGIDLSEHCKDMNPEWVRVAFGVYFALGNDGAFSQALCLAKIQTTYLVLCSLFPRALFGQWVPSGKPSSSSTQLHVR